MRIAFENSVGNRIDFSRGAVRAVSAEGITPYSTVNFAESTLFDGGEYISEYVGTRKIIITAVICSRNESHLLDLSAVTGAEGAGKLIFEAGGRSMEIACYTENSDIVYESMPAKVKLTFICLSPFFECTGDIGGRFVQLCGTEGRFEFEWEMLEKDNVLSEFTGTRSVLVTNNGSVSCGCVITLDVLSDTADIRVVNADSGKYIELSGKWQDGIRIVIDTRNGRKGVRCIYRDGSEENVIHRLKWGSDFFDIPAGSCRIYADSSMGKECISAMLYYVERYRGII